jgi:acylphosphatase
VAERIGRKVRIYGRVQGVFFRQWTVNQARALGVAGWVHNARDGSVEAHLEGAEGPVLKLIDRMRRGPEGARVEDVTVEDITPEDAQGFAVRL